jgi:hypothetical protein
MNFGDYGVYRDLRSLSAFADYTQKEHRQYETPQNRPVTGSAKHPAEESRIEQRILPTCESCSFWFFTCFGYFLRVA